jgi:hypothetical protein
VSSPDQARFADGSTAADLTLDRRSVLGATALGISAVVLPSSLAAASETGLLSPAGTFTTPTNFSGTAGDALVTLSWTEVANATGYQVQYRVGTSGPFTDFVDVIGGANTSVEISGLANGTEYSFQLIAFSGGDISQPSDAVVLTPVLTAPGVPQSLEVFPAESGQLLITWDRPTSGGRVADYEVEYRAGTSGSFLPGGITSDFVLTLTGLTNGTSYEVRVRARNAAGNSAYTTAVTGTPLEPVVETVASPEPQPPVVGVVTHPSSLVVHTDRLEASNSGFTYAWKSGAVDSAATYTDVSFAGGDATFTLAGVPSDGTYTVRKTNGTDTFTSTFTYTSTSTTYSPGVIYQTDNSPAGSSTFVGSVSVTLRGGGAGFGGRDTSAFATDRNGGAPSQPGLVTAIVPFAPGEQLRFAVGGTGGTGRDNSSGSGGGTNGRSVLSAYNGGAGGNAGSSGSSGAGGGGGAATVLLRGTTLANSIPVVIAGGAAGGGGGNISTGQNGAPGLSTPGGRTAETSGGAGEVRASSDAAGGGGGGGGAVAGLGGSLELSSGKYRTSFTLAARPGTNLVASGVDAATDGLASGIAAVTAGTATIAYKKVLTLVSNT